MSRFIVLSALVLAAAACAKPAPTTAPSHAGFEIPTSIQTQVGPVPVVIVDSIQGRDPTEFLNGGYDSRNRVVYLRRDLASVQRVIVFYHEVCHVRTIDAGLHYLISARVLQAFCDQWAMSAAADALHRRP